MKKRGASAPPFSFSTKKEQHISPPSDVQAPKLTPKSELSMNAILANNISQNAEKVNSNYEKSSEKDEKRYSVTDNAYGRQDKVFMQEDARSIG